MTETTPASQIPVQSPPAALPPQWRDRITGHGSEDPAQLLANPRNWRIHPRRQQDALQQALEQVGWVTSVIVNERTGHVVDGHLRVGVAISNGEPSVPVDYVDLTEEEEHLVLATLDPLAALAATDDGALKGLLGDLEGQLEGELAQMVAELTRSQGSAAPATPTQDEIDAQAAAQAEGFHAGDARGLVEVTCPHCGDDFSINPDEFKQQ